jgi:hypothetical protein
MLTVFRRLAYGAALGCFTVFVLAAAASLVRLLPWLAAPGVPLRVALPFAKLLLSVGLETACLLGAPLGCALGAAVLVGSGEARTLQIHGLSPVRLSLAALPVATLAALPLLAVLTLSDLEGARPGVFARELILGGLESCEGQKKPHAVRVPVVEVSWLCFESRQPMMAGPLPNSDGRIWFTAADMLPNDELTEFNLSGLFVTAPDQGTPFHAQLRVSEAKIRGLAHWGSVGKLSGGSRGLLVLAVSLFLSLTATFGPLHYSTKSRLVTSVMGLLPALAALRVLHWASTEDRLAWVWVEVMATASLATAAVLAVAGRLARRS